MNLLSAVRQFTRHLAARSPRPCPRRRRVRLDVERLDDRIAPAIITVGPGKMYATLSQTLANNVNNGDTIRIDAGLYRPTAQISWFDNDLTIEGVGGKAHLDMTGVLVPLAIFVLQGDRTTVRNIEFSGAIASSGANGGGIRLVGEGLTVQNCYFHDSETGVMGSAGTDGSQANSDILIEDSEFYRLGNGYSSGGEAHAIYIGHSRTFTLRNSYVHDTLGNQLVKSRAHTNYILYNRLTDGDTMDTRELGNGVTHWDALTDGDVMDKVGSNYEVDIPNGGTTYIIGNLVRQAANTAQYRMVAYNLESPNGGGASPTPHELHVINNTFISDVALNLGNNVDFIAANTDDPTREVVFDIKNNIFNGPHRWVLNHDPDAGGPEPDEQVATPYNWIVNADFDTGFVDRAGGDFRLTAEAVGAINQGVNPGISPQGFNLTPIYEYVHPLGERPRPVAGALDMGAFEFVPPPVPTNFVATAQAGQVALSWTASAGATYEIYRGTSSGNLGAYPYRTGITSGSFTDAIVQSGQTYYYQVRAVGTSGASARSTQASATPLPPAGGAPIKINFTTATGEPLAGYLADTGAAYGDRGNGQTYGWSGFVNKIDRDNASSPTEGHDSFIWMNTVGNPTWNLAVANGSYQVRVVAGDPNFASTNKIRVEGVLAIDGTTGALPNRWLDETVTVTVTDGQLTVANEAGFASSKICFLEVTPDGAPPAVFPGARIDFTISTARHFPGFVPDWGLTYGNRGYGLEYGWINSVESFARDHNYGNWNGTQPYAPSELHDTNIRMYNATNKWEIAVPNGSYRVRLVAGAASTFGLTQQILVENELAINGTTTSTNRFLEAEVTRTVTDGRLSVSSPAGVHNNWLSFIEVTAAEVAKRALNAGGTAQSSFQADSSFSGGSAFTTTNTVNTTGVQNAAPAAVYQSARTGDFTYTISDLQAYFAATVRLHFAETQMTAAEQRLFDVKINGVTVLSNFDIFQLAGGANKALVREFGAMADSTGKIVIEFIAKPLFNGTLTDALVCGIEIT